MSPRPRTVHDDVILDAAFQVLGRVGPERMTLADVGEEVGLSAATLVQRFGSKRLLMLSVLRNATEKVTTRFELAIATHESPLDALFAAAADRPGPLDGHIALANRLSFYLSQLNDPDFRAIAVANSERAIDGFKRLLESAIEAGELSEGYTDTAQLAETIYSMQMGSLMNWSVSNQGSHKAKVRRDLDILMRPYRRGPRRATITGHAVAAS